MFCKAQKAGYAFARISCSYQSVRQSDDSVFVTGFASNVQLLGEPRSVARSPFYNIALMYAALGRYCDAITPIETYVSFDPAKRQSTWIAKVRLDGRLGELPCPFQGHTNAGWSGTAGCSTPVSRWRETSHEAFLGAPVVACQYLADKAMSAFMSAIGGKADMAKPGRHVA